MSALYAGIETGGTKILYRVVDEAGQVKAEGRLPTTTPEEALAALADAITGACGDGRTLAGIGIASFGPLIVDPASPDYGAMLATTKPGWSGFNLGKALSERFAARVAIDTDVNVAALAEQALGAGKGCHTVAYVTVGTGIGGGLAVDGATLKGGLHPEIGHLPVRRREGDDLPSVCRFHPACAEGLASGPAVNARLQPGQRLADSPAAQTLVVDYVGQLVASLVLAWSPQRIVLGGGVLAGSGLIGDIEARMRAELNGYGAQTVAEQPGYLAAAILEHAGLEGALMMARRAAQGSVP